MQQSRSSGVYSEALGSWRGWGERAGVVQPRAGRPGDRGATVSIHPDSQQHRAQAWSPPCDREPRAFPGAWRASSIRRPPAPARPRPRACSVTGMRDARTPRLHTLREGAAGLTSLLLAEDDAALGVGERCRVTRAIAARARPRASSSRPGSRAGPAPPPASLPRPPPPPRPPGPQHAGSDAHAPVAGLGRAPPRGHVHPRAPPRRLQQSSPGHTSESPLAHNLGKLRPGRPAEPRLCKNASVYSFRKVILLLISARRRGS